MSYRHDGTRGGYKTELVYFVSKPSVKSVLFDSFLFEWFISEHE